MGVHGAAGNAVAQLLVKNGHFIPLPFADVLNSWEFDKQTWRQFTPSHAA
jgi:hypothetical protein